LSSRGQKGNKKKKITKRDIFNEWARERQEDRVNRGPGGKKAGFPGKK